MAKLNIKEIQQLAKSIVISKPGGIRYSALMDEINQLSPETPRNTISGAVWNLHSIFPSEISKPTRGLFVASSQTENDTVDLGSTEQVTSPGVKVKEADFYEPFANWLKDDLEEVTVVSSLGGAVLKSKWGELSPKLGDGGDQAAAV
jgi:hypothetical protein